MFVRLVLAGFFLLLAYADTHAIATFGLIEAGSTYRHGLPETIKGVDASTGSVIDLRPKQYIFELRLPDTARPGEELEVDYERLLSPFLVDRTVDTISNGTSVTFFRLDNATLDGEPITVDAVARTLEVNGLATAILPFDAEDIYTTTVPVQLYYSETMRSALGGTGPSETFGTIEGTLDGIATIVADRRSSSSDEYVIRVHYDFHPADVIPEPRSLSVWACLLVCLAGLRRKTARHRV